MLKVMKYVQGFKLDSELLDAYYAFSKMPEEFYQNNAVKELFGVLKCGMI